MEIEWTLKAHGDFTVAIQKLSAYKIKKKDLEKSKLELEKQLSDLENSITVKEDNKKMFHIAFIFINSLFFYSAAPSFINESCSLTLASTDSWVSCTLLRSLRISAITLLLSVTRSPFTKATHTLLCR